MNNTNNNNTNPHSNKKWKTVIIGTGPAGYTAAIYSSRANLNPLVFEGNQPGGQLTLTTLVENFPGYPEGIMGPELMENMKKQASHFGTTFVQDSVVDVDLSKKPFKIITQNGNQYFAETLIIASGADAKFLNLEGEKELIGRGLSTCATCDGFFYRNKIVHVVGGGDTALEDSIFITKFAKKVYIIHRRDELRASKIMQEKAKSNPKIEFIWNSTITKILHDTAGVNGITVYNLKTGTSENRATDGLFYAIGHIPNTSFLKGQIELNSEGFIKANNRQYTNIDGVFACGDVQDSFYRQAITAAGSGAMAAIALERYLEAL
ncbi:MAG: thioredoxin-disulfide reductase [Oligoflexia bacterium]|nr:thioredoxin-disulfide reductase [Oligoflexia bacterium]